MSKPYDTRLIMVVAQQPFEVKLDQFCKLAPAVYVDGTEPSPSEFPNDGEIWWMLTSRTASLAEPGRLVVGKIENAVAYTEDDPASSRYQAMRDSVRELEAQDGMEVLEIPGDAIDNIQELVSGSCRLNLPHRPTPRVMLRWRSEVFGPFIASLSALGLGSAGNLASFTPANTDMTIYTLSYEQFISITKGFRISFSTDISMTPRRRAADYELSSVMHEIVLSPGYAKILSQNPKTLLLEPIDRKLNRLAKHLLSRKKGQDLRQLIAELEITGRETQDAEDLIQTIERVKHITETQETALDAVAKAMLDSGILGEDRIQKAIQKRTEQYVEERKAALQAQIDEGVSIKREELRKVEAELAGIQARLQKEEESGRSRLEEELASKRKRAEEDIAAKRERIETERKELDRQQKALQVNLEQVTKKLRDAGDDVVNQFLTIAPLLGLLGLPDGRAIHSETSAHDHVETKVSPARFEIPSFLARNGGVPGNGVAEDAFFERFSRIVENSGFTYRPLDLKRFHVSVKIGALTVLGGPSGTGKSSLPLLYARALLGDEAGNGRAECLMINVNPSWMDIRDLMGHMNTLEGRFYPAESGLFQYLVFAEEEYKTRRASTGMYLTCLDEMNLSQVEHYFSDLMMVLEREGDQRNIQCFSPQFATEACPFRQWSTIRLSPAIRFIGTVNFDETTRLLSDRFLDRVNLIRLQPGTLPTTAGAGGGLAKVGGPVITLADFERWQGNNALPRELASLLDDMRPILQQMGCPMSPRVYRAICRFVGSCSPLLTANEAFDIQICQRVLPRIRSLATRRQLDALDELYRVLSSNTVCSFNETIPLLEEIRESSAGKDWVTEDE